MRVVRLKRKRPGKQQQHWPLSAPAWTALIPVTLRTAKPAATPVSFSFLTLSPPSLYRCPLRHLQFDFPTDAFDFSDESSPTEGYKGRTGKSSDKSKDGGTGLKKIFSGPKKVLVHFFPPPSNEVTSSSDSPTSSLIHVHLNLLRQPSSHVYQCLNFTYDTFHVSEQLAYINQAGNRGKIIP